MQRYEVEAIFEQKKDCHCITHCRNEHLHENVERFRLHGSPRNGH